MSNPKWVLSVFKTKLMIGRIPAGWAMAYEDESVKICLRHEGPVKRRIFVSIVLVKHPVRLV